MYPPTCSIFIYFWIKSKSSFLISWIFYTWKIQPTLARFCDIENENYDFRKISDITRTSAAKIYFYSLITRKRLIFEQRCCRLKNKKIRIVNSLILLVTMNIHTKVYYKWKKKKKLFLMSRTKINNAIYRVEKKNDRD